MTTCTPARNETRKSTRSNGSAPTTQPPRDTCPGVPDRLLRKPDADRVFEARVQWFLELSRAA